ncbi:MAG: Thymidylate synthase ThyX, partial [Alphaproteobacteria bacterium MarineAlpha2_Bin1]
MSGLTKEQIEEIKVQRSKTEETKRVVSDGLEQILYKSIPVLDHGFIRVIDYMGDDTSIVQAARVSYGKGTKHVSADKGLINYLMRHRHSTPFEMCEIKYHVKLPIFVARQWIRHRTASVNEYSARYSVLDKEYYIPNAENLASQSNSNKQGRGIVLEGDNAKKVLDLLIEDSEKLYNDYEKLLDGFSDKNSDETGLSRELARMNLSLNYYTQWYWKIDLHNLLHFLSLRSDSHAQYEIRAYADAMLETVKQWVPLTFEAFESYKLGGAYLNSKSLDVIKKIIQGHKVTMESS